MASAKAWSPASSPNTSAIAARRFTASTPIPLWSYIVENNVLALLRATGRRLCVHTVVTGGQALGDTLKGFKSLADSSAERNIVVWLNEYFGVIERDGKTFTEMLAYKECESKVIGVVRIPKRNQDTFGRDIEEVIARKLTFEDAIRGGRTSVMTKQRLKVVQRDLFEQLDQVSVLWKSAHRSKSATCCAVFRPSAPRTVSRNCGSMTCGTRTFRS